MPPIHIIQWLFFASFLLVGIWAVVQAWISQSRTETIHPFKAFVHLLAFYLSYLLFPLILFSIFAGWAGYYSSAESIFIFLRFRSKEKEFESSSAQSNTSIALVK